MGFYKGGCPDTPGSATEVFGFIVNVFSGGADCMKMLTLTVSLHKTEARVHR